MAKRTLEEIYKATHPEEDLQPPISSETPFLAPPPEESLTPLAQSFLKQVRNLPVAGGLASPEQLSGTVDFLKPAVKNFIPSAYEGFGAIAQSVAHPFRTAQTLGSGIAAPLVAQGLSAITGKNITPEGLGAKPFIEVAPGKFLKPDEVLKGVTEGLKERYGSLEAIGNTFQNDPFGFLMDMSFVLGGLGAGLRAGARTGALSKLADVSKLGATKPFQAPRPNLLKPLEKLATVEKGLGRAGEVAGKVSKAIDPAQFTGRIGLKTGALVSKVGGFGYKQFANLFSGRGTEALTLGTQATRTPEGLKAFMKTAYGGEKYVEEFVNIGRDTLSQMELDASKTVTSEMIQSFTQKDFIDIRPLKSRLETVITKDPNAGGYGVKIGMTKKGQRALDFSNSPFDNDSLAQGDVRKILKALDKPDQITPGELHNLKRSFDSLYRNSKNARAFIQEGKDAARQLLNSELPGDPSKGIPSYQSATAHYAEAALLNSQIERELGLGGLLRGGSYDLAAKRLIGAFKNDSPIRRELIGRLAQNQPPGSNIEAMIAGAVLSPVLPTGIVGRSALLGLNVFAPFSGKVLAAVLFGSPKVLATQLIIQGYTVQQANKLVAMFERLGAFKPFTGQVAFQTGRVPQLSLELQPEEPVFQQGQRRSLEEIYNATHPQ